MAVPIQKFREIVFQMLYSCDIGKSTEEEMVELLSEELAVTKKTIREAQERVRQIRLHLKEIDKKIAETSYSYTFDRIQTVERNILRLGTFELFYDETIPFKVVLSEAMRLARKFSTKESATFINAILDAINKVRVGETIDTATLQKTADELTKSEEIAHDAAIQPKEARDKENEDS